MQSTRTQGSNFREAYMKYLLYEKDHNNQIRHCQEETGEKQNWHRNATVSRMRANFGEVTISLPIERLRDRDLILPDFRLQLLCTRHGNSYFTCRWLGMCNIRNDTRKIIYIYIKTFTSFLSLKTCQFQI